MKQLILNLGAVCAMCLGAMAHAHVVLDEPVAIAGNSYRAALRVSHGCAGSPTTAVRVSLPAGLRGAKPQPKPGWSLSLRRQTLAQPYVSHGREVKEEVVEITWTANSREFWLLNEYYDEFVLRGVLQEAPGLLWFKVLQSCEVGSLDWSETPAQGAFTGNLKSPAAVLEVLPAEGGAAHQH